MGNRLEPAEKSQVVYQNTILITSDLIEAFLSCPYKCYLLSRGKTSTGSDYTNWVIARTESYQNNGVLKITAEHPHGFVNGSSELSNWKNASWLFALDQTVQTQDWESNLHVVQRLQSEPTISSAQLVPIRFVPRNKLSNTAKMLATFDALVLSKSFGIKVGIAKIVHGEKSSISRVNTILLSRSVHKTAKQVAKLVSATSPPDLILNRHCSECKFQDSCRKQAIEKDDLSLLSHMTDKERARHMNKGIFTVTQLSYTFRPRRRIKRKAGHPEKYHHALKALAIREQKIHIVGEPELILDGTIIFFDVEGLPDFNFYYLIGVRLENQNDIKHFSFWADSRSDEERIWKEFQSVLSGVDHPILVHYGSYETVFLKRMYDRYGGPLKDSTLGKAISTSINLLSVIYAKVYFPTYSNGLKEIAQFLGFKWSNPMASGLQSIAWRSQWELSKDQLLQSQLITYNTDDCKSLSLVTQTLFQLLKANTATKNESGAYPEIVHTDDLSKSIFSKWHVFKSPLADMERINEAAYWHYQRDRVFVRTGAVKIIPKQPKRTSRQNKKVEKTVVLKVNSSCPECGKRGKKKSRIIHRTVHDIVFGRDSVKRRVVLYVFQTYHCRSCGHEYGLQEWYLHGGRKWGWNVVAYFLYHIIGLGIPQLTIQHSLNRMFGFGLARSTLNNFKTSASDFYLSTKKKILERIVNGKLIHADETRANIKGHLAYVWVLTNMKEAVYILAESREGEIIRALLKDFRGVLVSDFYAAYEAIDCPKQKCLIHLMRDLNDQILSNPFDQEMKSIAVGFSELLRSIVETIDRYGLKKRYLRKHIIDVNNFFKLLDGTDYKSEASLKCKQRFEKNKDTLFTFLHYDGVPWNNNNAEHAIKAFAKLRSVMAGSSSKKGVDEYLTLLSVAETCEYQGLDFLNFLRSGHTDIDSFAIGCRKQNTKAPVQLIN